MVSLYVDVSTFLYGLVISYNEYFIETNTTNSTGAPTDDQRTALLAAAAAVLFACSGVECSGDHSRAVHPTGRLANGQSRRLCYSCVVGAHRATMSRY